MSSIIIEIALINQIIKEAIIHGADAGGSYEQNNEALTKAVNDWLEYKNISNDYKLTKVIIDGWNINQIVRKING